MTDKRACDRSWHSTFGRNVRVNPFRRVDSHSMGGSRTFLRAGWDWSGFLLLSKVDGRRISPFPSAKYGQLSTFGTLAGLQSQLFKIIVTDPESSSSEPNSTPRSSFRRPRVPQ